MFVIQLMIPIFDLDDTLYPERSYVESGFKAVSLWLLNQFGWDADESQRIMLETLEQQGRGQVFNQLLLSKQKFSIGLVKKCVNVYRNHRPKIRLSNNAEKILYDLATPIYLVTDGHKIVQQNKLMALEIQHFFKKVFITHRYGIKNSKPSIHCFEIIRRIENCEWSDMVYVGDNPAKDFVNLTPLGVHTIRIKTGEHQNVVAKPGFEASQIISNLSELPKLLRGLE
jgi:putative hydrolase of the HAD superfamily